LHHSFISICLQNLPSFTVADEVTVDSDDDNVMVVVKNAVVVAVIIRPH